MSEAFDLQPGERVVVAGDRCSVVVYDDSDRPLLALRAESPTHVAQGPQRTYAGPASLVLSVDPLGQFSLERRAE